MHAQRLETITGKLLVFLALGSFILSYAGMYAVAVDANYGWLSWVWPLVTEAAVIIFSLVYLIAKLNGYGNRWLMPLIILCTALSVGFNVWHAPKADWLTRAVVALPPLFLFAAFKTWIWKVEEDTHRTGLVTTLDTLTEKIDTGRVELDKITRQVDDKQQKLTRLNEAITQTVAVNRTNKPQFIPGDLKALDKANEVRQDKITVRRQQVLMLLEAGYDKEAIAAELDVSARTIARDIRTLNGSVQR